jgi:IS1 family transposase
MTVSRLCFIFDYHLHLLLDSLSAQAYSSIMNRLSVEQKTQVVTALIEGNSIRSTVRMTGVAKNSVTKLLVELANACAEYHDMHVRSLRVRRLQCDEIWAFVGAKAKNITLEQKEQGWGDVWTWTAIDADTKLCVSYLVGGRTAGWATDFMLDCSERIIGRPLKAVEEAFGGDAYYAMLHKVYAATNEPQHRYCPATCIGCDMKTVSGNPAPKHVSTSFVERQNLSMRMGIRRFTSLTNGFSKKVENHAAAVTLWFMYYNFCRIHQTLRVTPAMETGLANHAWTIEELIGLLQYEDSTISKIDNTLFRRALGEVA